MKKLIDYLPSFYQDSELVKSIMISESIEADTLESYVIDLHDNLRVDTATWGLEYFEKELNIKTDMSKSYQERREAIKAKKAGQGTTTIEMMKNTARAFTGGNIEVIEQSNLYKFIIKFVDVKGIPKNMNDFQNAINEIKPAHLAYEIQYLYNVWKFIQDKNLKWNGVTSHTWSSIQIFT